MTSKILIALLMIPALMLGLLLTADYAVVDIREGGADGHHLVVPVPLFLAQAALRFAPVEARYVEVPEIDRWVPALRRAVGELRDAGDGLLVRVRERGESVRIEKIGEDLKIDVVGNHDEEVHVTVPLDAVDGILASYDGRGFHTRDVVTAVETIGRGDLVHVRDGEDEVRVWIW